MARRTRFTVLLKDGQHADEDFESAIAIFTKAGATLRSRGRVSMSFDMDPGRFARFFGDTPKAAVKDAGVEIPPSLKPYVDLISIPPRQMLF